MQAKDYEVRIWWSAADGLYVAQVLDMPGIMAHGESREEAAREIHLALALALDACHEDGAEPPAPKRRAVAA